MKNQDINATKKSEFIKIINSDCEFTISDIQESYNYLKSEGIDTNKLLSTGLAFIKKTQLEIQAHKTKLEMIEIEETTKKRAEEWVNSLLSKLDFSIPQIIKEEKLTLSFKNVESLSKDDIKDILINHFTLKFLQQKL